MDFIIIIIIIIIKEQFCNLSLYTLYIPSVQ